MATIQGGPFDDNVNDGIGNDTLLGFDGNDLFFMQVGGTDTVDGGSGRNVVLYEAYNTAITIDLRNGTATDSSGIVDTLINIQAAHGSTAGDTIFLSDAGGYTFGRSGADKLYGGLGNDNFHGGSGNDRIEGGGGFDRVSYFDDGFDTAGAGTRGVVVNLTTGKATDNWNNTDTLIGIQNVEGSSLNDTLTGNHFANDIYGGDGNDTISGGNLAQADIDNDEYDYLQGANGNDTISVIYGGMVGGQGNDKLTGVAFAPDPTQGAAEIFYQDSPGGIVANLTNASFMGLAGGTQAAGFKIADGWGTVDTVKGPITTLYDSGFDDFVSVNGSFGSNFTVRLTGGDDTVQFSGLTFAEISYRPQQNQAVFADLQDGYAVDRFGGNSIGTDIFIGATAFRGSRADDEIHGKDTADQQIRGDDGNDLIFGHGGDDLLRGDNGNDVLVGGSGADSLDGGQGFDRVSYEDAPSFVTVNMGNTSLNTGDAFGDSYISIEEVLGSDFNDKLTGDGNDNWLVGGIGKDALNGGGGIDTACYHTAFRGVVANLAQPSLNKGDALGDTYTLIENLQGSDFVDVLTGNTGANLIAGGFGNDTFDGGAGADTFLFDTGPSSSRNHDTIVGFSVADDTIALDDYIYTKLVQGADFFTANATGTAADANDFVIYNTTTGDLVYDFNANGLGGRVTFATISAGLSLTSADFAVV